MTSRPSSPRTGPAGPAQVGRAFGISGTAVRHILVRHDLQRRGQGTRGPSGSQNPERDQAIAEARQAGKTLKQIGCEHGLTRERVRQILLRARVALPRKYDAQAVITAYLDGGSAQEVGQAFGISAGIVRRVLARNRIEIRPGSYYQRRVVDEGASSRRTRPAEASTKLAKRSGVSGSTVERVLIRNGVERRPRLHQRCVVDERAIIAAYQAGKPLEEIGHAFGISGSTIQRILIRNGVERRRRRRRRMAETDH